MDGIVRTGKPAQGGGLIADGKRGGNGHDRAEHHLGPHGRQCDEPQLLPAVADTVDHPCLHQRGVQPLEASDKRQKPGAQAHPDGDKDDNGSHIPRIGQPLNRVVDKPQGDQHAVDIPIGVTAEKDGPDEIHRAGNRGRVKNRHHDGPHLTGKLIDEPGEHQTGQIAHRAGNDSENKGVFDGYHKHVVVNKQIQIILKPNEFRCVQNVVIGKAVPDGNHHRQDNKREK